MLPSNGFGNETPDDCHSCAMLLEKGRCIAYPGGMACSTGEPQLLQNLIQGVLHATGTSVKARHQHKP